MSQLLIKEGFHYRGNQEVITSRPCVYGVFSGPLGGFAPRERLCVGCLRCTTQHPEIAQILKNPEYAKLGDSFFSFEYVDTVVHESEHGRIPIKGAGYRGKFGGAGWDGMWTDMSEIVRPTRDGIHGREYISTIVDLGTKPHFLRFDKQFELIQHQTDTVSIPIPILFDVLPRKLLSNREICLSLQEAAKELQTFAVMPLEVIQRFSLNGQHWIPLITSEDLEQLKEINFIPKFIALESENFEVYYSIRRHYPDAMPILRMNYDPTDLFSYYKEGVRIFHFTANYHGLSKKGEFVKEAIRKVHEVFIKEGCRDQVTLLGSGGIIAAEHVPKALICGLDAVVLDTPILAAMQAHFDGECSDPATAGFVLPKGFSTEWGKQRIKNLMGSWHDQLLEILGAMGLREVRRLRGEWGRAMLQKDLEKEAFTGIAGYES